MRPDTEQTYQQRILRALVHIQEHLDDDLPLEAVARVACFSPFHFHRLFGAMVGESVKEHIRRLRLERAAYRLQYGDQSVLAIALDAGYETHESFTRAFRAMFGVAPSGYRRLRRERRLALTPSGIHYLPDGRLADFTPVQRGGLMDVRMETLTPMKVAFLRYIGPFEDGAVDATWQKLLAWAGQHGLLGPRARFLGLCHDDPHVTPPDKQRYDACVVTDQPFQPEGEIGTQVIPGGEYAVATHKGPYQELPDTYARLYGDWLPRSGREPADHPGFQVYRSMLGDTPPEELVTDIYLPLRPR
jgi:AraC family transcriptional regulator